MSNKKESFLISTVTLAIMLGLLLVTIDVASKHIESRQGLESIINTKLGLLE